MLTLYADAIQSFSYPGGEQQVRIPEETLPELERAHHVNVVSRPKSPEDLVRLMLLQDAILGVNENAAINLILPYLPYARADRRFVKGDCLGIRIWHRFLDLASNIVTLDIHSEAGFQELAPLVVNVRPESFIQQAIENFSFRAASGDINILFPDEGAATRYQIREYYGSNHRAIRTHLHFATKVRDPLTGRLSGFKVPDLQDRPTLIVDDICDGGGTFEGIYNAHLTDVEESWPTEGVLSNEMPWDNSLEFMGLYTTHGIYSKGLHSLLEKFAVLYTTNSFQTRTDTDRLVVYNCLPTLLTATKGI